MRVAVTRPEADGRDTARMLADMGHEPVIAPLIAIVPTGATLSEARFDALVVTSANAIAALVAGPLPNRLRHTPLFAVGRRTAAAALARGFADVRSVAGDARSLLTEMAGHLGTPSRILYLAGTDRKGELEVGLGRAGHGVSTVETYSAPAAAALPPLLATGLERRDLGAVLHYSRRTAAIFARLASEAGLAREAAETPHHCISADAAEALRPLGAKRVIIAPRADGRSLLATLSPPDRSKRIS